jgi:hypothetical protein
MVAASFHLGKYWGRSYKGSQNRINIKALDSGFRRNDRVNITRFRHPGESRGPYIKVLLKTT